MAKTIVYIMGAGRSGTSLLDIVLGNGDGISSFGELGRYFAYWGLPHQYPEGSRKSVFWKEFKSRFESRFDREIDYNEMYRLERKFEYHSSFFRNYFGSNPETFKLYASNLEKLYETVFELSDDDMIIDSSKYPARALSLTKLKGYNLKFIYLRRHPVNVVNSFAKEKIEQKSKSWLGANVYYFGANFLSRIALRTLKKNFPVITLRYEDFIKSPEETLRELAKFLQIDLSVAIQTIRNEQPLEVGNLFDGNRIRLKDSVILRNQTTPNKISPANFFTTMLNFVWWN